MKLNGYPQNEKSPDAPDQFSPLSASPFRMDSRPSTDEVARKAYFYYLNEGSFHGRDVKHWLAAEAEAIAEHNPTPVHGFHN
jgi:hypothetical protein